MPAPDPDRLSALDAAFLDLDTARAPLHFGWTLRFAGPPPNLGALRRRIDERLGAMPRFRRRVVAPAIGFADPHWADDEGFDIARHVHAMRLAPPAGPAELRELTGVLLAAPLDAQRPLWRMNLVTGLAGGGFALVGQAHHALLDGVGAVQLAALLFDLPGGGPTGDERWRPEPAPTTAAALAATARARLGQGAEALGALTRAAGEGPGALRDVASGLAALLAPTPSTALDRSATSARRVAFAVAPLGEVRLAARRRGATVNDALLAAAAVATGAALRRRGERPETIRALVPASTRTAAESAAEHGNRIAFLAVDLPLAEPDPARVLRLVRTRTRARKLAGDPQAVDAVLRAADALPPAGRRAAARAAGRAARFTLVVSNVPGPTTPLRLLGRELLAGWPAVPLLDGHALAIGALSYAGRLHIGLLADAAVVPDVTDIARDLERALDALRALPAPAPTPWRARATARRARAPRAG